MSFRRLFLALVIMVCMAGFIHDAYTWADHNHKSFGEVLARYWYILVYVVAYAVATIVRSLRRGRDREPKTGSGN